ncbi:MAG: ribonuclease R, partial [bacterium]|nr:ribonuclease R [bacterium]
MKADRSHSAAEQAALSLLSREGRPMAVREIVNILKIPANERPALRKKMRALAEAGTLVRVRARYALPESLSLCRGVFRGHRQGYGFVLPAPGSAEEKKGDVFISRSRTRGAMDGDQVSARVEKVGEDGRREGSIVSIDVRAHSSLVGRLVVEGRRAWVEPQDTHISHPVYLPAGGWKGVRRGEWVEVEITRFPGPRTEAQGNILRAFGYPEDPAAEQRMIIAKYGLREDFPVKVLKEAEEWRAPRESDPLPEGVEDLRDLTVLSIDPRTARDRDDALSIEALEGGVRRLGVHIADVSHYVPAGTAIDGEASRRGNSVYFPDRAIPMLPPKLSGDVCSLSSGEVRRTLSAFLDFNAKGERVGFRLTFGWIRSRGQLTYHGAGAVLEGRQIPEEAEYRAAAGLKKELDEIAALSRLLHARRMTQGSLDFELPEAEVILDEKGAPRAIERAPRNAAHRLVEECMLAANCAVAEFLEKAGGAAVYRVHDAPVAEKLQAVRFVLAQLGLPAPQADALARPGALQEVLAAAAGKDIERFVNLVVLRSMRLARYAPAPGLHFGLGFSHYTHFTSPIRRYADLLVHRRLKRLLRGDRSRPNADALAESCAHISETERTAEAAERDMVAFHKALFMKDRVGERFSGHISGAAAFGIFVELADIFVEGMVPLAALADDYYRFIPEEFSVLGERTGRRFRLGDPVSVRVVGVDLGKREVEFELLGGGG